jgi:hypothetical protein
VDPDYFRPYLNKPEQRYLEKVQNEVKYCPICQPYEGDSYIWILGEETTLEDIFFEQDVPEKYRDDIASYIVCDNCGASNFDRYAVVGKEDRFDYETQEKIENAEKKYKRKINELQNHIMEYPSLALSTPLGRKIYDEILKGNITTTSVKGRYFRARPVESNKVYGFSDMSAPPKGCAGDGRYHHLGQSVLYIADSKETSIREVLDDYYKPGLVWLQECEVSEIDKVLDLRNSWDRIGMADSAVLVGILASHLIDQKVIDRKNNWKPEYFATRFIADCARLAGYNGIIYSSTRHNGDNVVLFDPTTEFVKLIGEPTIVVHKPSFQLSDNIYGF